MNLKYTEGINTAFICFADKKLIIYVSMCVNA